MTSSVTAWIEAARSISRWVIGLFGPAWRPAEEPREPFARHPERVGVGEVVQVEPIRSVGPECRISFSLMSSA